MSRITLQDGSGNEVGTLANPIKASVVGSGIAIYHDDGTVTNYPTSADTDAARGAALNTAMQAVAAGEYLFVGPGTYLMDTGSVHYKWTMPSGSTIAGAGRSTVIKATQAGGLVSTGIIMPGLNTEIRDLFFDTSAGTGGTLIFPIGRNGDTGSAYNVIVRIINVGFDSGTDGIYFEDGTSANQLEVYAWGLYGTTNWDIIVLSPSGVGSSHKGRFWDCNVTVTNIGLEHSGFSSAFFRSFTDFGTTDFEFYNCDVHLTAATGTSITFNGGGDTVPTIKVRGGRYFKGSGSTAFFNTGLTPTWDTMAQFSSVPTNSNKIDELGTIAANSASAGYIGEIVSALVAVGSPVSLTTNTVANVTSISLTAGDWDVEGNTNFTATTATITDLRAGIHTTTATIPTDGSEAYSGTAVTLTSVLTSITLPRKRISIAATTTVYMCTRALFSAGTVGAFGALNARRVR